MLCIAPTPDARCQFGEHADREDVEWIVVKVRLQQAFGDIETVLVQGHRRLDQARMPVRAGG